MIATTFKAGIAGIAVLVAAYAGWFILLSMNEFSTLAMTIFWLSPLFAALLASYLAPKRKVLLGASMALPAAILVVVCNMIFELFGKSVDLSGLRGGLITFLLTLAYACVLSVTGGLAGCFLSMKSRGGATNE